MIRALIVDDEYSARKNLEILLNLHCPNVQVCGTASSVETAFAGINKLSPDLLFLDIEMPGANGFELLKRFPEIDFELIFVTAYDHYALEAIKFSAIDYLLKPIDTEELVEAIRKMERRRSLSRTHQKAALEALMSNISGREKSKVIGISCVDSISFVKVNEIVRCQAEGNYTEIFLVNGDRLLAAKTLKDYEELLGPSSFFRVHNSHLINLAHIVKYLRADNQVLMVDGKLVDVSLRKKSEFLARLAII